MIFRTDLTADKIKQNSITRGAQCKEGIRYKCITRKAKAPVTKQTGRQNRPRLGQVRAGIRCTKSQPVADLIALTSKSSKIPMVQNVTKDSTDFPVPEQLITDKTDAITRRLIQDKNRELPFYPDLIYRPPPRPPENL